MRGGGGGVWNLLCEAELLIPTKQNTENFSSLRNWNVLPILLTFLVGNFKVIHAFFSYCFYNSRETFAMVFVQQICQPQSFIIKELHYFMYIDNLRVCVIQKMSNNQSDRKVRKILWWKKRLKILKG